MAERPKQMIVDTVDLDALGDKIRAKTGLTDKMTVKEMNAALDNVGGGGASIEWENAGILKNKSLLKEIYFNTNLSVEEVINIISSDENLVWSDLDGGIKLTVLTGSAEIASLFGDSVFYAFKMESVNLYAIANATYMGEGNGINPVIPFCYDPTGEVASSLGVNFNGWNPKITYPIKISNYFNEVTEYPIMLQSSKLMSTVPFSSGNILLSNTYVGNPIEIKTYGGNIEIDIEEMLKNGNLPSKIYIKDGLQYRADWIGDYLFSEVKTDLTPNDEFLKNFKNLKLKCYSYFYMFNGQEQYTTIPFEIDMIYVNDEQRVSGMFEYCKNLTNVTIKNIGISLQVGSGTSWGHLLTLDSLIGLCKECINTGSAKTLTVGSANLEKIQNSGKFYKFVDSSVTEIAVGEKGEIEECESTVTGSFSISDYMAMKNWTLA